MIRKLCTSLIFGACISIPHAMAKEPGADLVTTTGTLPGSQSTTMYIRVIESLDMPGIYDDFVLNIPTAGFPNTGMNNSAFIWAREQYINSKVRLVGTLDGKIYLYTNDSHDKGYDSEILDCLQKDVINLADYGMTPHLQNANLISQLRTVYPDVDSNPEINCERESFILRNLGMPIHFTRPFEDTANDNAPAILALADNRVFKVTVMEADSANPSLKVTPVMCQGENTCYIPKQPTDLMLASVLETKERTSGIKFKPADGKSSANIENVALFPDYATGISWELLPDGTTTVIVTLDSRNLDSTTKVPYDKSNEPAGCMGRSIIMRQLIRSSTDDASKWTIPALAEATGQCPKEPGSPGSKTKRPNSCHSLVTTTVEGQVYGTMQLHHHDRAYFRLNTGYALTDAERTVIEQTGKDATTSDLMNSHPMLNGHCPILFHRLPKTNNFLFPYYVCGDWAVRMRYNHAKSETIEIAVGSRTFLVACTDVPAVYSGEIPTCAYQEDSAYNSRLPIGNTNHPYKSGGQFVISLSEITLPHDVEFEAAASNSFLKFHNTENTIKHIAYLGLPRGSDHPYDQCVVHEYELKQLSL